MKLDSIIYDTNTLASAISEKLIDESPTFKAMYPSETATALVNLLAGYGSMLQYTIVSALANCYTDTAYSPTAIYQLAETLGNRLHGNVSSQVYCNIKRTSLTGKNNITIPSYSVFEVEGLPFFNPEPIVFPKDIDTVNNVLLIQGEYITIENYTNGVAGEKIYFSSDFKCNMNMVKVFINDAEWNVMESFLPLNSMQLIDQEQATTVLLRMAADGRAYIKFGNNSNGTLPQSGSKVRIEYVSNDGANGNIEKNNMNVELITPIYAVDNAVNVQLTVDISTSQPAYGGYNTQSLEVLRESSPYVFASGNRAVRRDDYKAILLNKCGYISANVWGEYEEAKLQGGYDKIMMNTVYYTGIKEIQQYDYRPLGGFNIQDTDEGLTPDNPTYFTNVLGSIKGFPGSYEIDLINSLNEDSTIKYSDKKGNGILVCDPSDNNEWGDGDGSELYPYNDAPYFYDQVIPGSIIRVLNLDCKQGTDTDVSNLITGEEEFHSNARIKINGQSSDAAPVTRISFDTPLQISLDFAADNKQAITMFAFKTPQYDDDIGKFPGVISIYATDDESTDDLFYTNIKNNSAWTRIAEVQTINIPEKPGVWSDWITTNLYDPTDPERLENGGDGWKKYRRYMIEIYNLHDPKEATWGSPNTENGKCYIGQMKFVVNEMKTDRYAWGGVDITYAPDPLQPSETVTITTPTYYTKSDLEPNYVNLYEWASTNTSKVVYTKTTTPSVGDYTYDENGHEWKIINSVSGGTIDVSGAPTGEEGPYDRNSSGDITIIEPFDSIIPIYDENMERMMDYKVYSVEIQEQGSGADDVKYLKIQNIKDESIIDYAIEGQLTTPRNTEKDRKKSDVEGEPDTRVLDHKTSTIDYENNSSVTLCIPELQNDMNYYKYNVEITGLTAANNYQTGDELTYSFNNGKYANVKVVNIDTGNFIYSINDSRGVVVDSSRVQRGNRKLDVADVDLEYTYSVTGTGTGNGAKLTVTSEDAINVYGTFTGNAYSTATAQSVDSPILEQYNHFTTYTEFKQPRVKNVKVEVTVEYKDSQSYKATRKQVEDAIYSVFNITPYYVGKSLDVADIWEAINKVSGVKRFIVNNPVDNVDCEPYEFISLQKNNLTINDKFNEDFK